MSKEVKKYIGWYLFVYVVVLLIYGVVQNLSICVNMEGFECNISESKILAFLTVIAYILTPIVAIVGFLNWRKQYKYQNQKERFTKLFESVFKLNSEIKILRSRDISIRSINPNETTFDYQENYLDKKYELYLDEIDKLKRIGEECLTHISILEFVLNKKMTGLKKLINNHVFLCEQMASSFYLYLKTYENRIQENGYNYLCKISSTKEEKLIRKLSEKEKINEYIENSYTEKLNRHSDRIRKYVNIMENQY